MNPRAKPLKQRMGIFIVDSEGFSLLELIVVVTVLGILGSISIPMVGDLLANSNVDELKALLNTAAADCLQKNRTSNGTDQSVDEAIISNAKLNTLGYAINPEYNTCSYLEIKPIEEKDATRFPIGFSVTNGLLLKSASVSEHNKSSYACRSWAGSNCKSSKELKDFVEYNKKIEEAEQTCNTNYANWTKGNPTACASTNRWDPSANSSCPTRPPKQMSSTCTPNGCNVRAFAFEGKIYNSEDSCQSALSDAWQKKCDSWVDTQSKIDNDYDTAETYQYCGTTKYWFCDGENKGDAETMNTCIEKKEFDQAAAKCELDKGAAVKDNREGAWPDSTYQSQFASLRSIPEACSKEVWICNYKEFPSKDDYDSCKNRGANPLLPARPPTSNNPPPAFNNPLNPTQPSRPQEPEETTGCTQFPPAVRRALGC